MVYRKILIRNNLPPQQALFPTLWQPPSQQPHPPEPAPMELRMKAAGDAPAQGDGAAQHSIFLPMMTKSDRHNSSRRTWFAAKQKTTRSAHHRAWSAEPPGSTQADPS